MSLIRHSFVTGDDTFSVDAFFRWRTAPPVTRFDSKQIYDNAPLFWDDAVVSGGGTGSSHSTLNAATTLSVSNTTAGHRLRQTWERFNYQPGKSQLIIWTAADMATTSGNTKRCGLGSQTNGLFFQHSSGVPAFGRRSANDGSPEIITRDMWTDPMDGSGKSKINIDFTKMMIFFCDFEWLGAGRVRIGVIIGGTAYVLYEFKHSGLRSNVYMSDPNLPLFYEIINDGSGPADTFDHICSTVITEGGTPLLGITRSSNNVITPVSVTTGSYHILDGIRLKSTHLGASVIMENVSLINTGNADFLWGLYLKPTTITGTPTWSNQTDSAVMTAVGNGATASGGYMINSAYVKGSSSTGSIVAPVPSSRNIGSSIAGTPEELFLIARVLSGGATNMLGSINWRELS